MDKKLSTPFMPLIRDIQKNIMDTLITKTVITKKCKTKDRFEYLQ